MADWINVALNVLTVTLVVVGYRWFLVQQNNIEHMRDELEHLKRHEAVKRAQE